MSTALGVLLLAVTAVSSVVVAASIIDLPHTTICEYDPDARGDRCASASTCRTFGSGGDEDDGDDADTIHNGVCYAGQRFAPVLSARLALDFTCPSSDDMAKDVACVTFIEARSLAECQTWTRVPSDQRHARLARNASGTATYGGVCGKCLFRIPPVGQSETGHYVFDCEASGVSPTSTERVTLRTDCDPSCTNCTREQTSSWVPSVSEACLEAGALVGEAASTALYLAPLQAPEACNPASLTVMISANGGSTPAEGTTRRCSPVAQLTRLAQVAVPPSGACYPLPGYSTLNSGPTITVACGSGKETDAPASPHHRESASLLLIIFVLIIVAMVLTAYFMLKHKERGLRHANEQEEYLQMHELQDARAGQVASLSPRQQRADTVPAQPSTVGQGSQPDRMPVVGGRHHDDADLLGEDELSRVARAPPLQGVGHRPRGYVAVHEDDRDRNNLSFHSAEFSDDDAAALDTETPPLLSARRTY